MSIRVTLRSTPMSPSQTTSGPQEHLPRRTGERPGLDVTWAPPVLERTPGAKIGGPWGLFTIVPPVYRTYMV